MRPGIIITLTVVLLSNLLGVVAAQELPDTSQVSIKIINAKDDPFDKQIVLTDKASQKVIKTIRTQELDPWPMNDVQPHRESQFAACWLLRSLNSANCAACFW